VQHALLDFLVVEETWWQPKATTTTTKKKKVLGAEELYNLAAIELEFSRSKVIRQKEKEASMTAIFCLKGR